MLLEFSKIAAPFVPFVAENIYRNLRGDGMPESVHLCGFPTPDDSARDAELEEEMDLVMTVVRLGRLLRTDNNLKVRQPLPVMHVVSHSAATLERVRALEDIVLDELNVKTLAYGDHEVELAHLKPKADFRRLGPRFGPKMKQVAKAIAGMDQDTLVRLAGGAGVSLEVDGESVELASEDVVIERIPRDGLVVASEGDLVVALETQLSDGLIAEGLSREFVSKVQNMRKAAGLEVTQRIRVVYGSDEALTSAVSGFAGYVCSETLAESCQSGEVGGDAVELDINGHACRITITSVE